MFVYLWERQYEDLSFFLWVPALLFGAATCVARVCRAPKTSCAPTGEPAA
jgi:hypothetical protein